MNICIVGTGYVGLVTGACLADFGMKVTCVDKVAAKIDALNRGEIPIFEPGLDALVQRNEEAGRLSFSTEVGPAIRDAQAIFIAVGTPPKEDGSADLSYVVKVAEEIAHHMNGYTVVVTKSTVPTGTGQLVERIIREQAGNGQEFSVVSNPEFLREGSAIEDFMRPDRLVIGARDERAVAVMREIYAPLSRKDTPMVITNVETSELIKYASNAFLATKITFINEVAELCEQIGADVLQVARGMGLDSRIGPKFLRPGPGYGGSCFPKDTRALADIAHQAGTPFRIVEAVVEANDRIKARSVEKVRKRLGGSAKGKTIGILGLSFKPQTDDMRDSPSIPLVNALVAEGATVQTFDPEAMDNAKEHLSPEVIYAGNAYEAIDGADAVVLVTEWNEFRSLDFDKVKAMVKTPVMVDLRNIYDPTKMAELGFDYESLGR